MTQEQKLDAIIAICREIIALGEKRNQGRWVNEFEDEKGGILAIDLDPPDHVLLYRGAYIEEHDAAFISACAGPAEAACTSTILAIKQLREMPEGFHKFALEKFIADAWPDEILTGRGAR